MNLRTRKLVLSAHVLSSVGWLGAVVAFGVLAALGLASDDPQAVQAAYVAMDACATWAILPLAGASLVTGIVQSLGTPWGLLRHYWVVAKLALSTFASVALVLHLSVIERAADIARTAPLDSDALGGARIQLVVWSVAAGGVLVIATLLSIFRPAGRTPWGRRPRVG